MRKSLLFLIVLVVSICCKNRKDPDLENVPEGGNYLLIDSQKYSLDSLSVTYQNTPEGRSYQIMAINRSKDLFMAIQYLNLETSQDLLAGEFAYKNSSDLHDLQLNHFHNMVVRCEDPNGTKMLLDGLGGAAIEGGVLKVVHDDKAYYLVAASTIGGRKVMFRYEGNIKSEEFDW